MGAFDNLPPSVNDTKVCTFADPNGTKSRIFTQSVSSRDPNADKKMHESMSRIQGCFAGAGNCVLTEYDVSAKAEGNLGPIKGTIDDKGAKVDPDLDLSKGTKVGGKVTICLKRRSAPESEHGVKFKFMGNDWKVGFPNGPICVTTPETSVGTY